MLENIMTVPIQSTNDISALLADACTRATRYLDDPSSILALLDEVGSPATVASNAGRYFGFVNGAAFPVCIAAQSLAAAVFEDVALTWLIELFGFPSDCGAALVP